jgi:hypothetical protein
MGYCLGYGSQTSCCRVEGARSRSIEYSQLEHGQTIDVFVSCACAYPSHGRDGKVFAWKLGENEDLDSALPADGGTRRKPWLLYSIDVKDMTFCGMDVVEVEEVSSFSFVLIARKPSLLYLQEV